MHQQLLKNVGLKYLFEKAMNVKLTDASGKVSILAWLKYKAEASLFQTLYFCESMFRILLVLKPVIFLRFDTWLPSKSSKNHDQISLMFLPYRDDSNWL